MIPPRPITVSDASFTTDVLESPTPVLVDFGLRGAVSVALARRSLNSSPLTTGIN